jgi:hypothetical protein
VGKMNGGLAQIGEKNIETAIETYTKERDRKFLKEKSD